MFANIFRKIYLRLPKNKRKRVRRFYRFLTSPYWFFKNLYVSIIRILLVSKKIKNLNLFEQKHYSQNGEDGIIKTIFDKIGITNKFCVEFGVEDGKECNTRYLIDKLKWKTLQMDGSAHPNTPIKKEIVNAENIISLFKKYHVPKEFDLLSIDIDSNDYWVWKAIKGYSPRVVVIEYNASIPPSESRTIKYEANRKWDGTNYFGASLLALFKLGESKNYTLIACDNRGINAFFIRNDLIKDNFFIKPIEKIYKPPKYGLKEGFKFIGHPKSTKKMIKIN